MVGLGATWKRGLRIAAPARLGYPCPTGPCAGRGVRSMPAVLPIGAMEFRDARAYPDTETYVDKSAFIGRILRSSARVLVFCRPRRFGKTLNITMLRE